MEAVVRDVYHEAQSLFDLAQQLQRLDKRCDGSCETVVRLESEARLLRQQLREQQAAAEAALARETQRLHDEACRCKDLLEVERATVKMLQDKIRNWDTQPESARLLRAEQALEEERRLTNRLRQQYEDEITQLRTLLSNGGGRDADGRVLRDELERARAELRRRNDDVLLLRDEMEQLRRKVTQRDARDTTDFEFSSKIKRSGGGPSRKTTTHTSSSRLDTSECACGCGGLLDDSGEIVCKRETVTTSTHKVMGKSGRSHHHHHSHHNHCC